VFVKALSTKYDKHTYGNLGLLYTKVKVILFCTLLQCSSVDDIMTKDLFTLRSVSDILVIIYVIYNSIRRYKES